VNYPWRRIAGWSLFPLVAVAQVACGPPDGVVEVQARVEEPEPSAWYSTGADSDLPFAFDDVVEVRTGVLAGLESRTHAVWSMSLEAGRILASRRADLLPGAGPVHSLVREHDGVRVVMSTGSTLLLDSLRLAPLEEEEAVRFELGSGLVSSILLAPDSGYLMLSSVLEEGAGGSRSLFDRLQRISPGGVPGETLWRSAGKLGNNRSNLFSQVSVALGSDTVFITKTEPPHLVRLGLGGDTIQVNPLDPPHRPVSKQTRDNFAKALRAAPRSARAGLVLPDRYPSLVKVHIRDGKLLGVPITGESDGMDTYGLDLYCGNTFERTLLNSLEITGVFILESGVLVVRTPPNRLTARVEFLPFEHFSLKCTHD
jgi:hypothetical protein